MSFTCGCVDTAWASPVSIPDAESFEKFRDASVAMRGRPKLRGPGRGGWWYDDGWHITTRGGVERDNMRRGREKIESIKREMERGGSSAQLADELHRVKAWMDRATRYADEHVAFEHCPESYSRLEKLMAERMRSKRNKSKVGKLA